MTDTILQGDVRSCLKQLEDGSVQCVITSPPYWGLRDYGTATWEGGSSSCDHKGKPMATKAGFNERYTGKAPVDTDKQSECLEFYKDVCPKCGARRIDSQIGLEPTPEAYVADLVEVFREVWRVLRNDGVLWLNLGDSYAGSGKGGQSEEKRSENWQPTYANKGNVPPGLKPKDLCMIPAQVAIALRGDGWYLRNEIIWNKPNPMPESATDRCTKSHEQVFLLTKSEQYFCDMEAIKEPAVVGAHGSKFNTGKTGANQHRCSDEPRIEDGSRNKRDVWTVATQPCAEAHFATFPPALIQPMILAGTSEKGCCPKCGKPWERIVQKKPNTMNIRVRDAKKGILQKKSGFDESATDKEIANYGEEESGTTITIGWRPGCYCGTESRIPKEELKADPSLMGPAIRPFDPVPCTVLDPFMGSGTVAIQCVRLHRHYLGCELSPEYVKMAERRINDMVGPLFVGEA